MFVFFHQDGNLIDINGNEILSKERATWTLNKGDKQYHIFLKDDSTTWAIKYANDGYKNEAIRLYINRNEYWPTNAILPHGPKAERPAYRSNRDEPATLKANLEDILVHVPCKKI